MEYVAIVTALALLVYMYMAYQVGAGRGKYNVEAPATSGDAQWERLFRLEQWHRAVKPFYIKQLRIGHDCFRFVWQ